MKSILLAVKTGKLSPREAAAFIKRFRSQAADERAPGGGSSPPRQAASSGRGDAQPSRALSPLDPAGAQHAARARLQRIVRDVLRLDEDVDPDRPFSELGVDSIIAMQVASEVNAQLSTKLRATDLYSYPSVGELASLVLEKFRDEVLERCLGSEDPAAPPTVDRSASDAEGAALRHVDRVPGSGRGGAARAASGAAADAPPAGIAVIGISGRFPGAADLDQFWDVLAKGVDCIQDVPVVRSTLTTGKAPSGGAGGSDRPRWGGILSDVDMFDPLFFNISPREAELMDPQQRIFLEEAWRAIEDAGYSDRSIDKRCGVFVGVAPSYYLPAPASSMEVMGSSNAILPARLSYFLDLKGPAVAVDTACSSSLVAMHLACQSILSGESKMAIAGGVSCTLIRPQAHSFLVDAGMLSPSGKCHVFDRKADGFVPAEGVGVIVLKRLDDALRDGDHIYGVIKGSALNEDGRTNGITAPSGRSQSALECEVYARSAIDPSTITYVEAHGTGTRLGDPIEVEALTDAFRKFTDEKQFCALGSVKSNIGHALAAAGVAGVLKVLLALDRKQIPPSLHFDEANENIDLSNTPFFVCQELREWRVERGGARRAAVSSFGFSGTNAHLVVEEAPSMQHEATRRQRVPCFLITLSAKREEALRRRCAELRRWIEGTGTGEDVFDVSFTLNAGRSHFPLRRAFVVEDTTELVEALRRGEAERAPAPGGSQVAQEDLAPPAMAALGRRLLDELHGAALDRESYKEKLKALADLYVAGYDVDWDRFYAGQRGRRVRMPTYPFAAERFWHEAPGDLERGGRGRGAASGGQGLHPLLDRNESTFEEQVFKKTFDGSELVLEHHVVAGDKVLPGAAYLEMARAAAAASDPGRPVSRIKNFVWSRPIVVKDANVNVDIRLKRRAAGIDVQISADGPRTSLANGQGVVVYQTAGEHDGRAESPRVDIAPIKSRCDVHEEEARIYSELKRAGFAYGEGFRGIREWWSNEAEALSRIELSDDVWRCFPPEALHPAILDCAVQTVAALGRRSGVNEQHLPFSVAELRLVGPLGRRVYAHVKRCEGGEQRSGQRYDVWILDEQGRLLVELREFLLRSVSRGGERSTKPLARAAASSASWERIYYRPIWSESLLREGSGQRGRFDPSGSLLLLADGKEGAGELSTAARALLGTSCRVIVVNHGDRFQRCREDVYEIDPRAPREYDLLVQDLSKQGAPPRGAVHLWGWGAAPLDVHSAADAAILEESLDEQLRLGILAIFGLGKALMRLGGDAVRLVSVYPGGRGAVPILSMLGGFARSVKRENSKHSYRAVEVDDARVDLRGALEIGVEELMVPEDGDVEIRRRAGRREVRRFEEVRDERGKDIARSTQTPFKPRGGVYLISGGGGGIGRIVARHLAEAYSARLVLVGRSAPTRDMHAEIEALRRLGGDACYLQGDVAVRAQMAEVVAQARRRFGEINGVLHAAGVVKDALVAEKTWGSMQEVLRAKVLGTINLDAVTSAEPLDFFTMFSSLSSVIGNTGQADYAAGNSFMDHFAAARSAWVAAGLRRGSTVSVNWPLWESGGMRPPEELLRSWGIRPLTAEEGVDVLADALRRGEAQVIVVQGERTKIARELGRTPGPADDSLRAADGERASDGEARARVQETLLVAVKDILKVREGDVSMDQHMSEYGFDSISLTAFASRINDVYDVKLTPAVLFGHRSLGSVLDHMWKEYGERLRSYHEELGLPPPPGEGGEDGSASAPHEDRAGHLVTTGGDERQRSRRQAESAPDDDDIAIIGLSAVLPQSPDLERFWSNLEKGRDLVTEIPPTRFDWKRCYGDLDAAGNITWSRWAGLMSDIDRFDAGFFNISPRESELMDPQQRIFLEAVWGTIENAGYAPSSLSGSSVGVFVGTSTNDYGQLLAEFADGGGHALTGIAPCMIANRISYMLNLRGPSEAIDTACSSSLAALHHAIRAIRLGECDAALAGGVNVILRPMPFVAFSKAGMLSPDGRCKVLDRKANGYVRGEGAGVVLLKPLRKALADDDTIHAVIKSTALNHGGRANQLTAPNPGAQADVIVAAHERAKVDPRTVGYIELHGTGTSIGDPIEINGLKEAFRLLAARSGGSAPWSTGAPFCGLGSVKSNIGHLEPAAGIAGLMKVVLALKNKRIPATIHFEELNPYIELDGSPFYVVDRTTDWQPPRGDAGEPLPRRAGISSFGFGGVNVHAVVEEAPRRGDAPRPESGPEAVILSAKSQDRLLEYARRLLEFLTRREESGEQQPSLGDIAYTYQVGRDSMEFRLALVVSSRRELIDKLRHLVVDAQRESGVYLGGGRGGDKPANRGSMDGSTLRELVGSGELARVAELWAQGLDVDWRLLFPGRRRIRVPLPGNPFMGRRHWYSATSASTEAAGGSLERGWTREEAAPGTGKVVLSRPAEAALQPAAGQLQARRSPAVDSMALLGDVASAWRELDARGELKRIRNVTWWTPRDAAEVDKELIEIEMSASGAICTLCTERGGKSAVHLTAELLHGHGGEGDTPYVDVSLAEARCVRRLSGDDIYAGLRAALEHGARPRLLQQISAGEDEAVGTLAVTTQQGSTAGLSALQAVLHAAQAVWLGEEGTFLPRELAELEILSDEGRACYVYLLRKASEGADDAGYNFAIMDESGGVMLKGIGLRVGRARGEASLAPERGATSGPWTYPVTASPAARVASRGGAAARAARGPLQVEQD
ncbi:SDR family NAD(P)-dependent oxidoreductase [Sorangium sp. So ce834]|uniref:SDR family NAD(P)-dependent oxidoreductase n=1 Tax=Sorangium sp. So ce834 TaxID=3133321 RepID=UPI003F636B8C